MKLSEVSRVLITGGAGFIGSHLADRFLRENIEVVVFDNLSTGKKSNIEQNIGKQNFTFIKGDLRDRKSIMNVIGGVDAVFHQAALVSVTRSVEHPLVTNEVNVSGTLNVLKTSVDHGVRRLVFASSSSVYGETKVLPKKEDMALKPISPYAVSKLAAESYVRVFNKVYGLETVCLRYFNVYGPRQTSGPYSGVIPIFIDNLLGDRKPVIFGDGEQTRDFTSVRDVIEANVCALTSDQAVGEVLNVATGMATSINDLARTLQKTTNKEELAAIHDDPRPGDVKHSYADVTKARNLLRYEPRVHLTEGLTEMVEYWQKIKSQSS